MTALADRFPSGHFYSPIPSLADIRERDAAIFNNWPPELPGIDLNVEGQLALLDAFLPYYREIPFTGEKQPELRYYFENKFYEYSDAIFLYCMIRHFKPRRIVEVGCGFSSAVMMDTSDVFFGSGIDLTFIDPDPRVLRKRLKPGDEGKVRLVRDIVQRVPLSTFDALETGDILFVDSSHVSKTGSDLNRIMFDVLPRLARGVLVHFHDVYYPLEYPRDIVYDGIAWNEAYLLRAFLQYNSAFQIAFFNTYLETFHRERIYTAMPRCELNPGGSIWLRRL
jgi:predicted O-methyltransferase YrrM